MVDFAPVRRACVIGFALFVGLAAAHMLFGTTLSEHEPNDDFDHANVVHCGDTVLCAQLWPLYDVDQFRVRVAMLDSIVATTFPCNGSVTNTVLVLYDDHDSVLAVDADSGPEWFSEIHYRAPRDADYFLRVLRHISEPDCTYSLAVGCPQHLPEAYDLCTTPRIIPALPYYNEGTTLGMTSQCGTAAPDVFYRFHNPVQGNIVIRVCSTTFDARVQILGSCCNDFLDDASLGCNLGAELTSYGLPEGDYLIMVEGTSASQSGNFTIEVSAQLPACPAPESVTIHNLDGYPKLGWPEVAGPSHFEVWSSYSTNGPFDHLGTAFFNFFIDSSNYAGRQKFYYVSSACPW